MNHTGAVVRQSQSIGGTTFSRPAIASIPHCVTVLIILRANLHTHINIKTMCACTKSLPGILIVRCQMSAAIAGKSLTPAAMPRYVPLRAQQQAYCVHAKRPAADAYCAINICGRSLTTELRCRTFQAGKLRLENRTGFTMLFIRS
jgi:hypothetical protein